MMHPNRTVVGKVTLYSAYLGLGLHASITFTQ
jgi:hypothetical protein